ncbi:hypothetical protein ABW21_db0203308 [Orbilia brochopaga]|nr:hypothetical protein ABW21_db0203308 [Drechslerella brochopaga]
MTDKNDTTSNIPNDEKPAASPATPAFHGTPIPPAHINHDPSHGRIGPILNIPVQPNITGIPSQHRAPGLDLSRIVPRQSLDDARNQEEEEGEASSSSMANTTNERAEAVDMGTTEADAIEATSLLGTKLPLELVPDILEAASYFPHATLASSTDSKRVSNGDKLYLTATIPDFPAFDDTTAGRGGAEGSVDELDDTDDEKWEPGTLHADGGRDHWHRDGRIANGAFVRMLKGGDEVRVVMKARYPGWSCDVENCEVECFWAV